MDDDRVAMSLQEAKCAEPDDLRPPMQFIPDLGGGSWCPTPPFECCNKVQGKAGKEFTF